MFRRYAIVNEEQKRGALAKVQEHIATSAGRKVRINEGWKMNPESVRELGTTPSETGLKQFPSLADFIGSCRLVLVGVYRKFPLITRRSSAQICPPQPNS
jgi:hypothetical protein